MSTQLKLEFAFAHLPLWQSLVFHIMPFLVTSPNKKVIQLLIQVFYPNIDNYSTYINDLSIKYPKETCSMTTQVNYSNTLPFPKIYNTQKKTPNLVLISSSNIFSNKNTFDDDEKISTPIMAYFESIANAYIALCAAHAPNINENAEIQGYAKK